MNQKITPLLIVLLVIASFLAGSFYTKTKNLEQKVLSSSAPVSTPTPTQPLAIESLKKYAVQLGLDSQRFASCLDNSEKAKKVSEDIAQGNSLGVRGTPAFFINGRFLGGAFPLELFKEIIDKELAGKGSANPKDYSAGLQQAAKPQNGQPPAFNPKPVNVEIKAGDPIKGPADAQVTIVEFSDFQCPYCIRASATIEQVMNSYGDKVRLVFKNYPLPNHQFAQKAAEAALCANDQGKFWEYQAKLFESQQ